MARTPHQRFDCAPGCPVEAALGLIGGKWKGVALYHLLGGTLRFSELRRRLPRITQRMLTRQLREMEADGLLLRQVYAEVPPRVEYRLSPKGRSLEPVIVALKAWGDAHVLNAAAGAGRAAGSEASDQAGSRADDEGALPPPAKARPARAAQTGRRRAA